MKNSRKITRQPYLFLVVVLTLWGSPTLADDTVVIPDANLKLQNEITNSNQSEPLQITQFTREEIEKSPVVNLSQLFEQEQSMVRLTNNSGDSSQTALSLRGFGDNAAANSLILVDGFPLTNPSLLAPDFNSIPLPDIERIDIFQGSEGTLWGDQAVGGVINIITKHPRKFFVDGIVSLGSYSRNYYTVLVGDKFKNGLFFKFFGLTGQTHNYRDHNDQSDKNAALQVGIDYARGMMSINLQSYTNTTHFPGGLSEEQFNDDPSQATDFNNYSHYQTDLIQLLNKQELSDAWRLETRLDHHQTNADGVVNVAFDRHDALTSINPRLIGHIRQHKMIVGYDGEVSSYHLSNTKVDSKTSATEHDLYGQVTTVLSPTVDLIVGARGAWQGNTIEEDVSNPAVNSINRVFVTEQGFTYHPNNAWSFFLRRDGNFSFPKANEQTWVPEDQTALNVQTGVSYEAGTTWKTERQKTQMSIYRLDLNNEIAFNPEQTETQPFGAYNNFDPTRRYGITLTENYRLTEKLLLDGQVNYVDARFASGPHSGNLIPAVPAITGNIGLDYAMTEHWRTRYSWLYTGTRYASQDVENVGSTLSSYWLNNIAVQYFYKAVSVNVEVVNVLNQQYASYAFYNTFTQSNTYYPAAGRNYLLTIKINL